MTGRPLAVSAEPLRPAPEPEPARAEAASGPPPQADTAPPEVTVLVPVKNEEGSVLELTARVAAAFDLAGRSFELVFVDDGSTDRTVGRVREAREIDRRVKLVRLRRNFGKAAALCAGLDHSRGRLVLTMDGDLQDDPEEIPRFLAKLEDEDLDLVSGWKRRRYDPFTKTYPSRLFNWVTRNVARVELHDFNCGFKLYRREVLEQIAIYGELHRYIPVLASRRGFSVGEIEVRHHPRRHGRSKYGWDRFYKGLLDLITVLFITKYTRRPLHLFGAVGLGFLGTGLAINVYLFLLWLNGESLSDRPLLLLGVLLMVLGIQVLTTGLVGEMITFKNFRSRDSYSVKEYLE
ncbi:MAG TPA: glycosyltransferase family 2 protein [Thermoanaerobaculia bacterium]|nr:glycosyltransferase family 2 protein [Thermoanaerobaculia bacterium]